MQSKYKIGKSIHRIGLFRGNLLLAGLLLALLAATADTLSGALLLWLSAGWLGITASLLEFSHRRPAMLPWQLLPSLLLTGLLWVAPDRYPLWLWVWAMLIMLPQPRWLATLTALLALLSWWSQLSWISMDQAVLSGLVLIGLLILGLARQCGLQQLHGQARQRMRLVPELRLWPKEQLESDLVRERSRAQREEVHAELLLLRTQRHQLWVLARQLCSLTRRFESCYRIDSCTLAALLLSQDSNQSTSRRQRLLRSLDPSAKCRALPLSRVESLSEECHALVSQHESLIVVSESAYA
ncbi:hypothetical protein KG088_10165 [Halomonas sp. TRM85114]|uniref:hypothetical protein n=1 Tax=Halomonas jincaotanensis TaxID=2810616 RepID=UPI001BD68EBE|nr:hypothetical protein [Halomonas jincaotanensis]MBS9403994.1 hypothetical protein [Halomonas jincaotanensis]